MKQHQPLIRHHFIIGWSTLLLFILLGLGLEAMHAFKSEHYLGVEQEVRRLMWTLSHAHGVGLALLHMGFSATLQGVAMADSPRLLRASQLLIWATILLPGGFFAGGIVTYEGDPGLGVLLAPVGALSLLGAVVLVLMELRKGPPKGASS